MGKLLEQIYEADTQYLMCIKTGLLAHMQGYAPQVSIEFARKILPDSIRPTFAELENAVNNLSSE